MSKKDVVEIMGYLVNPKGIKNPVLSRMIRKRMEFDLNYNDTSHKDYSDHSDYFDYQAYADKG